MPTSDTQYGCSTACRRQDALRRASQAAASKRPLSIGNRCVSAQCGQEILSVYDRICDSVFESVSMPLAIMRPVVGHVNFEINHLNASRESSPLQPTRASRRNG